MHGSDKKAIIAWCFYDWGNSAFTTLVVTFIYSTYFSQAMAPDPKTGMILWSRAMSISAVLIAILAPLLGALADRGGNRRQSLILASLSCMAFTALLAFIAPGDNHAIFLALGLFVLANTSYEMGIVFYNAYLPDLAPVAQTGRVSGYGWGLGYVGGILCLLTALITLLGDAPPFNIPVAAGFQYRATALLAALWFFFFSLPFFLLASPSRQTASSFSLGAALADLRATLAHVRQFRNICRFLIAHLIYNDGLVTLFAFGGIYAAGTFGMTINEVVVFGIVLNIAAGCGAFLFGHLDDAIGGKKTILLTLTGLVLATLAAALAQSRFWFWLAGIAIGLFVGPNQSASRSLMARLTPPEKLAQFYGFFTLSGKLTAFLGPLLLGAATGLFQSQRAGVATIIPFFLVGGLLLLRVGETQPVAREPNKTFTGQN